MTGKEWTCQCRTMTRGATPQGPGQLDRQIPREAAIQSFQFDGRGLARDLSEQVRRAERFTRDCALRVAPLVYAALAPATSE